MPLVLSSCAPKEIVLDVKLSGGSEAANAVACTVFDPIEPTDMEFLDMSKDLQRAILKHNEAWLKLCKEKK